MEPAGTFKSDKFELSYFESKPQTDPANSGAQSPETIILIHGFASNSHMNWIMPSWFKTLNDAGYHVVSLDNRGHGFSDKPHDVESYGAHLMAGDVKALRDHLGLDKVHIMGYSMGARISAFVTDQFPEMLKSVTFAGMGFHMVRGMGNPEIIARALEAPKAEDVTNPAARNFRDFAEQTKSDLKALAACIRSTRVPVTKEALAKINIPALVAVGTTDVIAGSGEKLAELIPGAQHLPIPNRDHMLAVGDEVYKKGVVDFFASLKN